MTYVSPFLVGIFPFWDLDSGARDTTRRIRPETLSRARAPANSAPADGANTPFFRPTASARHQSWQQQGLRERKLTASDRTSGVPKCSIRPQPCSLRRSRSRSEGASLVVRQTLRVL